jgi:hypothetical protein
MERRTFSDNLQQRHSTYGIHCGKLDNERGNGVCCGATAEWGKLQRPQLCD